MSTVENCLEQFEFEDSEGSWEKIQEKFPPKLKNNEMLYAYYKAQQLRKTSPDNGKELLKCLSTIEGFIELEEEQDKYFAEIDILVHGKTNRS